MLAIFKRKVILSIVVGILAFSFLSLPTANAQESTTASGLRIAPLRSELVVSPGKSDEVTVKLKNVTAGRVVVRSVVLDFEPKEDGSPNALPQTEKQLPTSIRSFLTPNDGIQLDPGAEYDYKLPINIPSDTPPGAYYGLVLFQGVPADQADNGPGQVALTASVAHIVLVQVPGNITEQLQILFVKAARQSQPDAAKAPIVRTGSLFSNAPNQIQISVKNTGNGFLKPFGNIVIQDWRGNEVSSSEVNANDPKGNVFPDATRVFTTPITEVKGAGRYTVLTSIGYGDGNEVITVKSTFWVIPFWLVGVIAVALALLIFVIMRVVKRFRR